MELLKVPQKIFNQYREDVKNNTHTSFNQVERKLTRNFLLSDKQPRPDGRGFYCRYGRMHFIVSENNAVVWMRNHSGIPRGWKKDFKYYLELNEQLGIEDDSTMTSLVARDIYYKTKRRLNKIKWKLKGSIAKNGYIKWHKLTER